MPDYRIDKIEVTMNASLQRVSSKRYILKQNEGWPVPTLLEVVNAKAVEPVVAPVPVELTVGGHQMLRQNQLLEAIKHMVGEQLGIKADDLNTDSRFVQDLGCDSLDTIELVMALEDDFSIEINDEDAENMINVGDVMKYMLSRGFGRG